MNNPVSIIKIYFFAAAILTGCCFVTGCENDQKDIDAWTKTTVPVDEAKGVTAYLSQEGTMKAKLSAPFMLRAFGGDTTYIEFPKTLHIDFYNDSTQVETWLDCLYGKYFENIEKAYLRDSVVVISVQGDTLKCPDLWWDQRTRLFYTDKYAIYHAKGKHIYGGEGLEATQDLSTVTFKKPVGDIKVSENGLPD